MRNVRITLEYDGTDFVGWQSQASGRTVQEEITKVLQQVLQEKITLHGAGRTDSGVHARGQVANFLTGSSRSIEVIRNALNGILPDDICLRDIQEAPPEFHARFDARARLYRYDISTRPLSIGRRYRWFVKYSLDVGAMRTVATRILGEHDFESFCNYAATVDHYRCVVSRSEWTSSPDGLVYTIQANRFLHGMVRALVGTMIDIGRGHTALRMFEGVLEAKDRTAAGMAAPPHGLCLEEVLY